ISQPDETANRNRFARMITRAEHGSDLLFGATWMKPGEVTGFTSFADNPLREGATPYGPRHEVYFVIKGQLEVVWDQGVIQVNANEAIFLPPGWSYQNRNRGQEDVFFVYAMTPPAG